MEWHLARLKAQQWRRIQKKVTLLDWQGTEFGREVLAWVEAASEQNYSQLSQLPECSDKVLRVFNGYGQDRDLVKIWVDTSDAASQLSREIQETITSKASSGTSGNKDSDAAMKKMCEAATGIFSQTTISGFSKLHDFWTKVRTGDTTEYRYYTVYGIALANLDSQIGVALGKVKAENEEEKEALKKIEDIIKMSVYSAKGNRQEIK